MKQIFIRPDTRWLPRQKPSRGDPEHVASLTRHLGHWSLMTMALAKI